MKTDKTMDILSSFRPFLLVIAVIAILGIKYMFSSKRANKRSIRRDRENIVQEGSLDKLSDLIRNDKKGLDTFNSDSLEKLYKEVERLSRQAKNE